MDDSARAALDSFYDELKNEGNLIFSNEIYDNAGNLRCEEYEVISDYELLRSINWLVEGVEVVE